MKHSSQNQNRIELGEVNHKNVEQVEQIGPMVRAYTVQPGPKRRANRIVRQLGKQQWGKVNSGLLKATRAQRLRAS